MLRVRLPRRRLRLRGGLPGREALVVGVREGRAAARAARASAASAAAGAAGEPLEPVAR